MNIDALIEAVRIGDIEAAQALLPVDPVTVRAREICGRHFGDPARFLRGECDDGPHMGAVREALSALDRDTLLRMARAALYQATANTDYLTGCGGTCLALDAMADVLQSALSA